MPEITEGIHYSADYSCGCWAESRHKGKLPLRCALHTDGVRKRIFRGQRWEAIIRQDREHVP